MRITHSITAALVLLLLSASAWARVATVVTNAGVTATGEVVTEDQTTITLSVAGVPTVFQRQDLKSLTYQLTPEEEYAQRRGKLADTDIKGRLDLAQWLYNHGLIDLAHRELTDLRQRAPDNEDVDLLSRLVDKAIADRAAATSQALPAQTSAAPGARQGPPARVQMLSPEDINMIRIWDIDLRTQPNVIVPRSVIDTLFTKYSADPAVPVGQNARDAFLGHKGYQQLGVIFDLNASPAQKVEDFYSKITVTDDPPSIVGFRMFHQNYVVGYCATAKCHGGGPGADKLLLFNRDATSPITVYTNFYILQSYANAKTEMVDRQHPEMSLLIQYGMARANAVYPHPDVTGWRPAFVNGAAPLARTIREWVRKLGLPRFPYPFSYTPTLPLAPAAPAPAPAP